MGFGIIVADAFFAVTKRGRTTLKDYYTRTLRNMLIIRVFLVPFAVMLVVYGTIIYFFASYSVRQVRNELVGIAEGHRNIIDQFLSEKAAILQFTAASFSREQLRQRNHLDMIFKNLQTQSKAFFDLGVFDQNGRHVAYAGPFDLLGKSYAEAEWFKRVQNVPVYISDEFLGYRQIPHFIIAVKKEETEVAWYLRATIDTYYFNDLVENIRIGSTGEAYIVNREGVLQTKRRSGGRIMEPDPDFVKYATIDHEKTTFFTSGGWRNGHLYASAPIQQTNWQLIVRQSIGDAYAPLVSSTLVSFVLLLGGSVMVVLMGFFMAANVAAQLKSADLEKREMKTQLILAGKLAEVGEMSTGIAHEINNPLQVMKSEVAMIQSLTDDISPIIEDQAPQMLLQLKDCTREIGDQINRCSHITQGLLNFARKRENTKEPIVLEQFVPKMVQMVDQRARLENIRIVQEIQSDLPQIVSDPNQLQQVFLNLFNNAIYALKERISPEIRVRVTKENMTILISVSDNGCGFSPESMEKAFLPFYTTKPVGQGTGLGLSTVYGIIKGLGGDITLTSEQGAGSEFQIRLPIEEIDNTSIQFNHTLSQRR